MKRIMLGLVAIAAMALVPTNAGAQSSAEVTLVHGLDQAVDVVVDGTVVIDNFLPGTLANISSFAGRTLNNVEVKDEVTGDVLIGPVPQIVVPSSGNHSIVAHLAAGAPVLNIYENDVTPVAAGQGRVTIRHVADAPAVDIIVGSQRPVTNLANGSDAKLTLPAGTIDNASIALTGEDPIADIASFEVKAGTNTVVYAIGAVSTDTIDFVVQVITIPDPSATSTTTTTTIAGATTTTVAGSTTTTTVVPTAVNTGSPIDGSSNGLLIAAALGGLLLAGGAVYARRRV